MSFAVSSSPAALGVRASVVRAGGAAAPVVRAAASQPAPRGLGGVSLPSTARRTAAAAAVLSASLGGGRTARNVAAAAAAGAAAGGGDAVDPFKALGVKMGAEADEIKKALDRKKLLYKTEPEKLKKMEEAYEAIVQASLQARLKGDLSGVNKNILQADKVSLFGPWAPIKCESPLKDKKVNIAISLAAVAITYGTPGTLRNLQPVIYATIFQIFRMFSKLVDEDPGPSPNIDREGAQKHNNKRFFRSFALVIGTFGVSLGLTYWLPNIIFEVCKITVPVWYLLNQEVYVTALIAFNLAYLTCFYR